MINKLKNLASKFWRKVLMTAVPHLKSESIGGDNAYDLLDLIHTDFINDYVVDTMDMIHVDDCYEHVSDNYEPMRNEGYD